MTKDYKEYRESVSKEQASQDYDSIKASMASHSEHLAELDHLPKQNHIWIDRGLKHTCENAGHPYHEAWKVRRPTI
jgi:hypothetical protein